MTNGETIKDFLKTKGVSKDHFSKLLGLTTRAVYNIMNDLVPTGVSNSRKYHINKIFKSYNYLGRV